MTIQDADQIISDLLRDMLIEETLYRAINEAMTGWQRWCMASVAFLRIANIFWKLRYFKWVRGVLELLG